jgi:hypothetical protein
MRLGGSSIAPFFAPIPPNHLGGTAVLQGSGYRADGSYQLARPASGFQIAPFADRMDPPLVERIRHGLWRFKLPSGVSQGRLALLRQALAEWRRRGTVVLGILPPFSAEGVEELQRNAVQKEFWNGYLREVPRLFAEQGFPCLDASTTAKLGLEDIYLRDGVHAMETWHLHALRNLLKDEKARRALPTALPAVEALLNAPGTNSMFVDYSGISPVHRSRNRK